MDNCSLLANPYKAMNSVLARATYIMFSVCAEENAVRAVGAQALLVELLESNNFGVS